MLRSDLKNGINIIHFEEVDKITALNAELIKKELNAFFNKPNSKLVINLQKIAYIDSTGFGTFLSIMKTSQSTGGEFKICNVNQDIMKLFRLLHLDNIFEIYNNVDECVSSFPQSNSAYFL